MWMTLGANFSALVDLPIATALANNLTADMMRNLEWDVLSSAASRFFVHTCEIINFHWFKLLNFGITCYSVIDN